MKFAIAAAICLLSALAAATSAQASASSCPGEAPHELRFGDWGDDGDYFLAPGGDFESPSGGWTLERGAAEVADASPDDWGVSLSIPPAGSATSPPICVADGYRHGRMFGQSIGIPRNLGTLMRVDVLDADTGARIARIPGLLALDRSWDPTSIFLLGAGNFLLDPVSGLGEIRLRFTTLGPATALIDGVYIDPSARN